MKIDFNLLIDPASNRPQLLRYVTTLCEKRQNLALALGRSLSFRQAAAIMLRWNGPHSEEVETFVEQLAELLDSNAPKVTSDQLALAWRTEMNLAP